ncbi:MAG: radical SAM family heme chaperone HemW [Deltaproteobacteria bacterium]|nr:radical SAM family heme chaperone HemW [Deltaproteobacteria bacterium]MBW2416976.1 radical SAM family heme chaperone HemW [Deltaproteobacteria bacterium]
MEQGNLRPQGPARSDPRDGDDGSLGVYVHVPFCERVCPYCDFAVVAERKLAPGAPDRYVAALLTELEMGAARFAGRRLETLYFGGGTPSLLAPESLGRLIEAARSRFGREPAPLEITLEVNPSSLERSRLRSFREAGIDRLSIGVQSFDDTVLRRLGRAHRAGEARRTLEAARSAGFQNLSLDLIFAAPDQRLVDLERDLDEALSFAPEHLSVYELTVEAATPFALAERRGQLRRAGEAEVVEMVRCIEERSAAAGLARYELSSYARPGREARHNSRYWARRPVLGIGMGAWSCEPPSEAAPYGARRVNPRDLAAYLERVEAGQPPEARVEILEPREARAEALFLALRRREGLAAAAFALDFGAAPRAFFAESLDRLTRGGLLEESPEGNLRLTERGRLLADSVFERFV